MSPVPRPVSAVLSHIAERRTFLLFYNPARLSHFVIFCDLRKENVNHHVYRYHTMQSSMAPVTSFLTETASIISEKIITGKTKNVSVIIRLEYN